MLFSEPSHQVEIHVSTHRMFSSVFGNREMGDNIKSSIFEFFTSTQSWQCWHYCQLCVPIYCSFLPYLHQLMLVSVKLEIERYINVIFQGYTFYWTRWFLMAHLKPSWQCGHSCIVNFVKISTAQATEILQLGQRYFNTTVFHLWGHFDPYVCAG